MPKLSLAVMITTHNRLDDLKRTLNRLESLSPKPDEILVTADGCHDGTEEWLRENGDNIRLFANSPGKGSIASRHNMMLSAESEFVVSLDDDSYPAEANSLAVIEAWMKENENVAVLTFPQRSEEYPESLTQHHLPSFGYSGSFPNSGACYRRSVYSQLPGFNTSFFHAYEEPDYALQCIAEGLAVYHSNIATIRHHYSSVGRNEVRTHHRHARNEFWSTLVQSPWFVIPFVVLYRALRQMQFAFKHGGLQWLLKEPVWWCSTFGGIWTSLKRRTPVSLAAYSMWIRLMRKPFTDSSLWDDYTKRIDNSIAKQTKLDPSQIS